MTLQAQLKLSKKKADAEAKIKSYEKALEKLN